MASLAVPVGIDAPRWTTVAAERTALIVVHNLTTLNRLLDVVGIFDSDFRVQVVMTSSLSDPFSRGLLEVIAELGYVFVPWEQATQLRFDLIVAASHHGHLDDLHGPLMIMSHGIGYTKYSPGLPTERYNARSPEPGARSPEPGARSPFGLSRQWLLYDGVPVADALIFSHPEQVVRLAADVPEALPSAVLAGDPCYDRMLASLHHRTRYRAALGVENGRRLIVTTSTWSTNSLLGSWPTLLRQLLAELPVDEYQVAAITHPNSWQAHGSAQLKAWLADCVRAGLILIPPLEGWRAALLAADLVVGDHGATCCYGAALQRPVLLGAFPDDHVVPETAVHRLGRLAGRLRPGFSLRAQVETAIAAGPVPGSGEIAELVSALPGEAAGLIRAAGYRLLGLAEPEHEATVAILPTDGLTAPGRPRSGAMLVACQLADSRLRIERFPADLQPAGGLPRSTAPSHLVVHRDHPDRRLREAADVVLVEGDDCTPDPRVFTATIAERTGRFRVESGRTIELSVPSDDDVDPSILASLAYSWKSAGRSWDDLTAGVVIETAVTEYQVIARWLD